MPEVIIKYKNKKTLKALEEFAKSLDFSIITPDENIKTNLIKDVMIIPANESVDLEELEDLFSNRNLDAKKLRQSAWQRLK